MTRKAQSIMPTVPSIVMAVQMFARDTRHAIEDRIVGLAKIMDQLLAQGRENGLDFPIPMKLHCEQCKKQHIDAPDEARGWTNPPHRTHECQFCGWNWRPSDFCTEGVDSIGTSGRLDGTFHIPGLKINGQENAQS